MVVTAKPDATTAGTYELGGELVIHRMGYGAMRLTGEGIWGPPRDREEARRVLRRAVELGVDFIDTADAYGPYVSEELIAEALHPYPAGLVIGTKGGLVRSGPDEWQPNGRPDHLRETCEGSLQRLRIDRIDLYQLHRIDPDVPFEDQMGVLQELRDEGKILHVGLSEVGVEEIRRAREHLPVASVQNEYNWSERRWEEVVDYCTEEGIAFIPWFPLGAGDMTSAEVLREVAGRLDATPAQIALAWLLHRSPVVIPIPGTSQVAHLEENVAAAALELGDDDLELLARASTS